MVQALSLAAQLNASSAFSVHQKNACERARSEGSLVHALLDSELAEAG